MSPTRLKAAAALPTLLCLLTLIAVIPARAQFTWKKVANFDRSIGCGYFFDENHGLIGTGVRRGSYYDLFATECAIYKTTDGGATWNASALPLIFDGAVTSIWMTDTLTGYASIAPAVDWAKNKTFFRSSLWKTTDGGDSWFDPYHADHAISCVYAQNDLLITTIWDGAYSSGTAPPDKGGADISFDNGVTWKSMFRRGNGIAFTDSLNGVVTEQNANFGGRNFWCTTDAGRSWQPTANQYESWSIYTLPRTGTYFTANESQPGLPNQSINWSTDGGRTWSERYRFNDIRFTGTINGKGHTLYVQTDTTNWFLVSQNPDVYRYLPLSHYGLFRSDDLGLSWRYIGGPSHSRDTRFCVTGCAGEVVYAFDAEGGVYKTVDGGDGSIPNGGPYDATFAIAQDSIEWWPESCSDSIGNIFQAETCVPFTVDDIVCERGDFTVKPDDSLPRTFVGGQMLSFENYYEPSHLGDDTAIVRIFYRAAYKPMFRDVKIISHNPLTEGLVLSRDTSLLSIAGCTEAEDTIHIGAFGCGEMTLDSVITGSDEITILNQLPMPLSADSGLRIHFAPDSAGERQVFLRLAAHAKRRSYDTTIVVTARSVEIPMRFIVDTSMQFTTDYCRTVSRSLLLATPMCDTLWIDSLRTSNAAFSTAESSAFITTSGAATLSVNFVPDSLGVATSELRIFGHGKKGSIDTTVQLFAINRGLTEALTMTKQSLDLRTALCRPINDSLIISNQSCDTLYLDSIVVPATLYESHNAALFPLASNDSAMIAVRFDPDDGKSRTLPVRLVMHTAHRKIDTTIWTTTANAIPINSLVLSTDSLWMWTKYCQPIATRFRIFDSGCHSMTIDSVTIAGDTRKEFSLAVGKTSLSTFDSVTTSVAFTPDTSGQRDCRIHVYLHEAGVARDTLIALRAENHTAPEPYLAALPSIAADQVLRIPVMLHPALDTFSMSSYSFTLLHNTNLITAIGLDFANTCSMDTSSTVTNIEGSGTRVTVKLGKPITHKSDLTKPVVYVLDSVRVAPDTMTDITIAAFATDQDSAIIACSVPAGQFVLDPLCGNPSMLSLLRDESLELSINSISPNPSNATQTWSVRYTNAKVTGDLAATIYDTRGSAVFHTTISAPSTGKHALRIPVPVTEGDYFFVLECARGQVGRKLTVRH